MENPRNLQRIKASETQGNVKNHEQLVKNPRKQVLSSRILHRFHNPIDTMKILYRISFLLLCCVWISAEAQPDLPGCKWTTFAFDDGTTSSEGCLVDGKPEGVWRTYHPDGSLKSEGNRKNFELDGVWQFFREDGTLERELVYSGGQQNGPDCLFNEEGICVEETPWQHGVRHGTVILRFPNGVIQREIPIEQGLENGRGLEYSSEGRLIAFLDFRDGFLRSLEQFNRFDSQGKRHGVWVEWRDEAYRIKVEEGPWRHGVRHGVFKFYDREGNLDHMLQYENGELLEENDEAAMLLDIRRTYHENGQVQSVGSYRDGEKQGVFRMYSEDGDLTGGELYENGRLVATGLTNPAGERQGEWILYWDSGEIRAKGGYADGMRDGEWTFYFESGEVAQTGSYRAGEFHGPWVWYYAGGKIHREERYRNGKPDGAFRELDRNGDVLLEGEYIGGQRNGAWIYAVNDHREAGEYVDGEWHGEWIHTYDNDQIRFRGSFNFGSPDGKHEMWYRSGQRKWIGKYEGGVRDGKWFFYDEFGGLESTLEYDNGELKKVNGNKVTL